MCDAPPAWLQSLREEWVGKDVLVTVREVAPEKRKVVIDMQQAAANQLMRSFAVRRIPGLHDMRAHLHSPGRSLLLD